MWRGDVLILPTCALGELSLHRGLPALLGEETECFKTPLWNGGILPIDVTLEVFTAWSWRGWVWQ